MNSDGLKFTKARFWKCALQVNPFNYISYRGSDHGLPAEQYNKDLLRFALEKEIKILGIADHGNVDGISAIKDLMNKNGIVVFPGFEIASSEKVHFVCLFHENTTIDELNRFMGSLELLNPQDGARPSRLSAEQLLKKVEEDFKGFAYAAHCTDNKGILKHKLDHVWRSPFLKAAQIPKTLDDLRNGKDNSYYQILTNKDPAYRRETPIAIINAKDVAEPKDLANDNASCLIKMTRPCFESFKQAFQDPESRVRLNSDVSEKYYSRIESIKITGGYLDALHIDFSEHLNAIIGGRGTGKSTLIECIRYAFQLQPIGENAKEQHKIIIKENLGKLRARIDLVIRSSKMNGKIFKIGRRYGESTSVEDENGIPSVFSPIDLLPGIEIYGQNEIYEIAQDLSNQRQLLSRFLEVEQRELEVKIQEAIQKLAENRKKLIEAQNVLSLLEDESARIPKLEAQIKQYKVLGLEEQLKIIPLLEIEKHFLRRAVIEEPHNLNQAFQAVKDHLPDSIFLNDSALGVLPHADNLRKIRTTLDSLNKAAKNLLHKWEETFLATNIIFEALSKELNLGIQKEESILEEKFQHLPSLEGKSGKEIGVEYQNLLREIEQIRPKQALIETRRKIVEEFTRLRTSILNELSALRAKRSSSFEKSLHKLNKKLAGKLKLSIQPESDRSPLRDFLLNCKLEGIGDGRLSWIQEAEDFSPVKLAEIIQQGSDALRKTKWGVPPSVSEALTKLSKEQILTLEEIELPDKILIELNTSHTEQENFRSLDKLSTGQQCTAILHLLLLQNIDPLIMDQPEDNLDNAFIADRIVAELRSAKIARQFIFATHNANIPVFGDAEWIGVFDSSGEHATMSPESQGAIDLPHIKEKAANILEGGKTAFNQRKEKYGF